MFLLFASVLMLVQTVFADIPESTGKFVNDYTGVLTKSQTENLEEDLSDYSARTSNQICVVVVDNFGGIDSAKDYAMLLGNKWGIGSKRDNGVMLIVKVKNDTSGDVYLAAGYGVENILTHELCENIINEDMMPDLSQEDYYEAIHKAIKAIESKLGNQVVNEEDNTLENVKKEESSTMNMKTMFILGGLAFLGLLGYFVYRWYNNKPDTIAKNMIVKARSYDAYEYAIKKAQGILSENEIESAKRSLQNDLEQEVKNVDSIKQIERLMEFTKQLGFFIDFDTILEKKRKETLEEFSLADSFDDVVRIERKAKSLGIHDSEIEDSKKQCLTNMRNNALDALCKAGPTEWAQCINAAKQLGCTEEEISRAKMQGGVNIGLKAAGAIAVGTGAVVASVGTAAITKLFGSKEEKDNNTSSTIIGKNSASNTPQHNTNGKTKAGGGGQFGNTGAGKKF